jgi:hypothetical protein
LAALLVGTPVLAASADRAPLPSDCFGKVNKAVFSLLDEFEGLSTEVSKITNKIHDNCGMKILTAGVAGNFDLMKSAFECETNDVCALKAAIDLAYQESKNKLKSPMNPEVLYAIAEKESSFQQFKKGTHQPVRFAKALGLMQVEPASAKEYAGVSQQELERNPYKNALAAVNIFIAYRNKLERECGFTDYMLDLMTYTLYNGGTKYVHMLCHRKTVPHGGDLGGHVEKFEKILRDKRYTDELAGCPNIDPGKSDRPSDEFTVEQTP